MRDELVRLADRLDNEGKHTLAAAVDDVLQVTAAGRPKAPLKGLSDDVKKDLLQFLHNVKENIADSMDALDELFGRLRYFDIVDDVKDLGLEKTLKELGKTHSCVDSAFTSMYARTHGRRPSKAQMAADFGGGARNERNPIEFFESNAPEHSNPYELEERDDEGLAELEKEIYTDEDSLDEDIELFWGDADLPEEDVANDDVEATNEDVELDEDDEKDGDGEEGA